MSDETVIIHTDGACSGNPGPGGWGAILEYGGHRKELKGGEALIHQITIVCGVASCVLLVLAYQVSMAAYAFTLARTPMPAGRKEPAA